MKLLDFIVCDDIRQEMSGKHTLIGVYDDIILYTQKEFKWPFRIKLGFFIRIKINKSDLRPDFFNVEFIHDGKKISSLKGNLKIPNNVNYIALALVHSSFPIPNVGKINFKIILKKDNKVIWKEDLDYSMGVKIEESESIITKS